MRVRSQRCVLVVGRVDPQRLHPPAAAVRNPSRISTHGRLARAVRPEQREHLALLHLEADVAHGHGVAVGLGEVLHAHRRHGDPVFPAPGVAKPPSECLASAPSAPTLPGRSPDGDYDEAAAPTVTPAAPASIGRSSPVGASTLSSRSRSWRSSARDSRRTPPGAPRGRRRSPSPAPGRRRSAR